MRKTLIRGPGGLGLLILICAFLVAPAAWAQQAGAIAGQVTDTTGGALPGVTVEVNSPALIGGVQVVFTDGEGRYNTINLPIGAYAVTFTLPGFSTIVRDGIDIGAGFTANIDVELSVGAVEETITVTGAAPVVDVQTVRQQRTLPNEELEVLPSGNFGLQTLATVTPGFQSDSRGGSDVGGTVDTWAAQGSYRFYHGKPGTRASFNGFRNQYYIGSASGVAYVTNSDTIAEMQLEISGMGAEAGSGSVGLNAIPKEGSNTFTSDINGKLSTSAMHSTNLNPELEAFGLTPGKVDKIYRAAGTVGGPIMQDRLWFFGAVARWGARVTQPGAFFNALQGNSSLGTNTATLLHEFDTSRPADNFDWYRSHALRLTYQLSERNRFGFFGDIQKDCRCTTGFSGNNAIEYQRGWDNWPTGVYQVTWTNPVTSRILLEAGHGFTTYNWINFNQPGVQDGQDRSIRDRGLNYRYGAPDNPTEPIANTGRSGQYFSLSYVTGTHNVKIGMTTEQAFNNESKTRVHADGLNYGFRNGIPERLDYFAQPFFQQEVQNMELGLYAQDAWTLNRLTLNLGLRLDYLNMGFPGAELAAGPFVPFRTVEARSGIPNWKDINPRLGGSYDLFGTGRTALKVSMGRYNELSRSDLTRLFHPFSSSINAANRDWDDLNGDFIPDCELANFSANGECGAISNSNFGIFLPTATLFDDSVIKNTRPYTWDFLTEIQHELFTGFSVAVGYNNNWSGGFRTRDNLLVETSDFDEYCVTVPLSPDLPNGGGNEICGFYDINPARFGQVQQEVIIVEAFEGSRVTNGTQQRYWHGFTGSVEGRFPNGILLAGGLDIGRQVEDFCYSVDAPNDNVDQRGRRYGSQFGATAGAIGNFCRVETPWSNLTDLRLRGAFPLPKGLNFSYIYKNIPGLPLNADAVFRRNGVRFLDPAREALSQAGDPAGRLSRSSVLLPIHELSTVFTGRLTQLDLRLTKTFNVSGMRIDTNLDLYNALNGNSVQAVVNRAGSRFRTPTSILAARLLQLTTRVNF